ncbi:hypothetical protein EYF80_028720 [Liparis tanakae]|uniref:Uncharacterized protein n=1 Tax=Liparis tanakae TaxID=230148 RepID=A0A4Z2H5C8_9TELE|nr:hypothetical protein EYF80_028720 [Liparis tanakae]
MKSLLWSGGAEQASCSEGGRRLAQNAVSAMASCSASIQARLARSEAAVKLGAEHRLVGGTRRD